MKILILTSRFPYPLEKGDKLRAYYQIRELSKIHEVCLVSIVDEDPNKKDIEKIKAIVSSLYILRLNPMDRYISLTNAIFSGLPFQIAWFYNKRLSKDILQICADFKPDHIYCQLTRMAEYCKTIPIPKTLDYMDSFGVGMKRRVQVAKGISKLLYRLESQRMIKYESEIAEYFNHLTIISQQDKDNFEFEKAKEIHVINNGIDQSFFENLNINKTFDLVFVGNMSYLPNIEAAEYLASKILPLCPVNTSLLIAGTNPADRIKNLADENVTISGWMDDIRLAYGQARVFVAPLWSGTGQQNKILEAMAMGIPSITTTAVNNAINAQENKEIMIANDEIEFVNHINILLSNKDKYHDISHNAKTFVARNFDWNHNGLILSSIFAQNLKAHGS